MQGGSTFCEIVWPSAEEGGRARRGGVGAEECLFEWSLSWIQVLTLQPFYSLECKHTVCTLTTNLEHVRLRVVFQSGSIMIFFFSLSVPTEKHDFGVHMANTKGSFQREQLCNYTGAVWSLCYLKWRTFKFRICSSGFLHFLWNPPLFHCSVLEKTLANRPPQPCLLCHWPDSHDLQGLWEMCIYI